MWRRRLPAFLTPLVLVLPLAAQSAALAGTVVNDSSGEPIAGAELLFEALGRVAITNAAGQYVLTGLPPGVQRVLVRRIGYHAMGFMLQLPAGDTLRREVRLEPQVVELEPVEVTGRMPQPRGIGREAFDERRRLGFGRFVDSAEMRRSEHLRLTDVLKRQGVEAMPAGAIGKVLPFNPRIRDRYGKLSCLMEVYLDGFRLSRGGNLEVDRTAVSGSGGLGRTNERELIYQATDLRLLLTTAEVEAIEIYRRASEIPQEYGGATAACGVILIWSRRGP